jgi:hypothetical protein
MWIFRLTQQKIAFSTKVDQKKALFAAKSIELTSRIKFFNDF